MYDVIVIVGNGKTSRENVEALLDDYLYANKNLKFLLIKDGGLSDGQRFAEQYLKDKGFDVRIEHGDASFEIADDSEKVAFFILWDDEDRSSTYWLTAAALKLYPCFDLTNGLYEIRAATNTVLDLVTPDYPEAEKVTSPEPVEVPKEESEEEDEAEYDDALYEAIRVIAGIFAEEFKKAMGK